VQGTAAGPAQPRRGQQRRELRGRRLNRGTNAGRRRALVEDLLFEEVSVIYGVRCRAARRDENSCPDL
jgi:hypothetical protein